MLPFLCFAAAQQQSTAVQAGKACEHWESQTEDAAALLCSGEMQPHMLPIMIRSEGAQQRRSI